MKETLVIKDCVTKETIEKVMKNTFYEGYRKISLKQSEVVVEIKIKIPHLNKAIDVKMISVLFLHQFSHHITTKQMKSKK